MTTLTETTSESIRAQLNRLIELKSNRDRKSFTSSQLAKALDVPRTLISRLLYADPNKRVTNPTIETLLKIIDYFQADGFEITLDSLLGLSTKAINVQDQKLINIVPTTYSVTLYALSKSQPRKVGAIDINLIEKRTSLIAYQATYDIKPFFKAGSIFVVDLELQATNNSLVAAKDNRSQEIIIRKYYEETNRKVLRSYDTNEDLIVLSRMTNIEITGVVIQVNAKT